MEEYGVNDEVEAMMKKQMSLSTSKEIAKKQSKTSDSAAAAAAPARAAGAASAAAADTADEDDESGLGMTKTMYAVSQASEEMAKLLSEKKRVTAEMASLKEVLEPQLEAVRDEVRHLGITSIYQVQAFDKPPKVFGEWVKAVCHELGLKAPKKWKTGQNLLKRKDLKEDLCKFDPAKLQRKHLDKVRPIIEKQTNYYEPTDNKSLVDAIVGSVLSNWACSMYRYGTQIVPKKEQLAKLEKQIELAKSDEHKMAEHFVDVRMKYMKKLFGILDADGGGTVDFKELQHKLTLFHMKGQKVKKKAKKQELVREKIGIAHSQASKLMTTGDKDGGYVGAAEMDFEEFTAFMLSLLKALFLELDANGNGKIDSGEVKEFLRIVYGPGMGFGAKPPKDLKKLSKKMNKIFKSMRKVAKKSTAKGEKIEIDVDAFIDFSLVHISSKAALKKNTLERLLCAATLDGGLAKAMQTTGIDGIQAAIAAETRGDKSRFGLESVVESNDVKIGQRDGDWVKPSHHDHDEDEDNF